MYRRSMRQWSSAFSMPAVRLPARRCANITACLAAAIRVQPVRCSRKRGYTTGGSSSGSAALVAAGEVDMAIGGIVGLKPTFGLVPYTGIGLLEITIDTCGP